MLKGFLHGYNQQADPLANSASVINTLVKSPTLWRSFDRAITATCPATTPLKLRHVPLPHLVLIKNDAYERRRIANTSLIGPSDPVR